MVEAVHGEVSKGSRWSIPDLLGQFWVTLPLFFNDGVQEPCHLQDLDRDLCLRGRSGLRCGRCGHGGSWFRIRPGFMISVFKDRADRRRSEPRSPVIGELRAQTIRVQWASPAVTEMSNNAIEEKLQRLGVSIAICICFFHKDLTIPLMRCAPRS